MSDPPKRDRGPNPGLMDRAIGVLNGWLGDHLAASGNGLSQDMAFYRGNRAIEIASLRPADKICVLVHGLGCNESTWRFRPPHPEGDYGSFLEQRAGFQPLYLRFNSGRRVSENGRDLAELLEALFEHGEPPFDEILLVGHSMGGLVIRSACHQGNESGHRWLARLRHAFYLGSPHLGAPLEKAANLTESLLGRIDTAATQVVGDVMKVRSAGIKDLRYGNLLEADWRDHDPDELLSNRRVPVPWLPCARHHRIAGHMKWAGWIAGDALVGQESAAGEPSGGQPGATELDPVEVLKGIDHMGLARHPRVLEAIERAIGIDV